MADLSADSPAARRTGGGLSLKGRALRYLAQREHSRLELERKLRPHEESPGQLVQLLDDLQAKDLISEARVAESVINRRAVKLGAARVRQELQAKGLGAEVVAQAMRSLQASELDRARAVWQRKFSAPAQDAAGLAKQMRFLASRGFATDTIRQVVSALAAP